MLPNNLENTEISCVLILYVILPQTYPSNPFFYWKPKKTLSGIEHNSMQTKTKTLIPAVNTI